MMQQIGVRKLASAKLSTKIRVRRFEDLRLRFEELDDAGFAFREG